MNITEITVAYGLTHNLGDYSNVRPELRLTATIAEDEDATTAVEALFAQARAHCEAQADIALERHGRVAHFSDEPRFIVIRSSRPSWGNVPRVEPPTVAIIPEGTKMPDGYVGVLPNARLAHARHTALRLAQNTSERYDEINSLVDCSHGDLSQLPRLPELDSEPVAAAPDGADDHDDPDD